MKKKYEKPEMIEHGKLSELTQVLGPSPGDNPFPVDTGGGSSS